MGCGIHKVTVCASVQAASRSVLRPSGRNSLSIVIRGATESPEKKSLMFFHVSPENTPSPIYIFMIATAPIDKTYPSPSEPTLHAQRLMSRI